MGSRGNTRNRSTVIYKLAGATATAGSKQLTRDVQYGKKHIERHGNDHRFGHIHRITAKSVRYTSRQ